MAKYSEFEFRTQDWFDPAWFDRSNFRGFSQFIPMKTIVIHCFDPRAAEIPQAVADHFGDEVYPGENILNEDGYRMGNTRTLFAVSNAGGRAVSALQSVATMDYLFQLKKVVVVHHSFCGASAFTPDALVDDFRDHHHVDISTMFERDSLAIPNFEESIRHDVQLLRASPAVPRNINLYGFFYEINSGALTEVVRDLPAETGA
jgi:carbonic anhydrase